MDSPRASLVIDAPVCISAEEMQRRRVRVRKARAHSAIEGIPLDRNADPVFDAYIRGEIEVTDMVPRLKAIYGLS